MRNLILSVFLLLTLLGAGTWINQAKADVTSLSNAGPIANADLDVLYNNKNQAYSVNWTVFQNNVGRAINWTDLKVFSATFAVNGDHSGINWGSFGV